MNFPFINEKLNKKESNNHNTNNYDYNSIKTSSMNQFLTSKKDNLNPSSTINTLDNSKIKENDLMKNLIDSKFKPYISRISFSQKPELKMKPTKKTLRMNISRNTIAQIKTLKNLKDKKTQIGIIQKKMKIYDFNLAFLSIISIFCAIMDNEYYIKKTFSFMEKKYGFKDEDLLFSNKNDLNKYVFLFEKRKISPLENFFRAMNLISSFLCFIILILKYNLRITLLKIDKKISEYDGFLTSGILYSFFFESFICLISYPPKINKVFQFSYNTINYIYTFNNFFLLFNFCKLYNLFRILLLGSRYNSRISETVCQTYNAPYNLLFKIRAEINSRPIFFCILFFLFFILISTSLLRNFEAFGYDIIRGYVGNKGLNDLRNSMNNIWLNIISISGIAYGDEYPRSNLGRITIFISSIFGIFFLGFLVAGISSGVEFNNKESRAYMKMKKIFSKENLEHKSAEFIKAILLLKRNRINYKSNSHRKNILVKEFIILTIKLYNDCLNYNDELYVARYYSIPMINLIRNMEVKLYDSLVLLTKHLKKVDNIDIDLVNLEKSHKYIYETMKNVNYKMKKIEQFLIEKHNNNYLRKEIIKKEEEKDNLSKFDNSENENTIIKIDLLKDDNSQKKIKLKDSLSLKKSLLSVNKINPLKRIHSPRVNQKKLNKFNFQTKFHDFTLNTKRNISDTLINKVFSNFHFDFIKKTKIRKCKSLIFHRKKIKIGLSSVFLYRNEKNFPKSVRKKRNIKFVGNH